MKGVLVPQQPSAGAQRRYRSLQCTGCHALGDEYGLAYRLFAGPDLVVYHALADAIEGDSAPISFRSCVVAPGVTRLPVHQITDRTRLATAFAVWMGLEKLADDVADEGSWLKWLAVRAFSRGHQRARATLEQLGFPVQAIREALARQQQLEAAPEHALDRAIEPTRTIAGLAFGALGTDPGTQDLARRIGERIGSALFWLDNALDLPGDLAAGRYNALARTRRLARGARFEELDDARQLAIGRARDALAEIEPLLVLLPGRIAADLVHAAAIRGLRTQLDTLETLPAEVWQRGRTGDLQRWRPAFSQVLARRLPQVWERVQHGSATLWWRWTWKVRMAGSLLLAWSFPRHAWAQQWWPEEPPPIDTAAPPPEVALDGLELNEFEEGSDRPCDILCGSFGTCDLETICDDCCTPECN